MASQTLTIQPLTKAAFAPFGDVVEADPATMRHINGGTTERYHALAHPEALGEGAELIVSLFRGQPRKLPYAVNMSGTSSSRNRSDTRKLPRIRRIRTVFKNYRQTV